MTGVERAGAIQSEAIVLDESALESPSRGSQVHLCLGILPAFPSQKEQWKPKGEAG